MMNEVGSGSNFNRTLNVDSVSFLYNSRSETQETAEKILIGYQKAEDGVLIAPHKNRVKSITDAAVNNTKKLTKLYVYIAKYTLRVRKNSYCVKKIRYKFGIMK